jgi:hypothetical protein
MKLRTKTTISEFFSHIKDPRIDRTKRHQLIDIITITLCAVISGADSWVDIELYGQTKRKWLKKFLELPNGIPSHDTFARVFARLDPEQLQQGCIVTLDAIGCQKNIVSQIVSQEADYVITLKKNQVNLYDQVEAIFKQALRKDFNGGFHIDCKVSESSHGRQETRYYRSLTNLVERPSLSLR